MLIVACSLLTLAAAAYVLQPLFREPKGNIEAELLAETELDRLLNRKAVVYSNLKDLEFEYKMGRLADGDFKRLEAGYKSEAALILKQLDALGVEKNLDEAIEREVAGRRSKLFGRTRPTPSGHCPECGAATVAGKKFCADCGHRLE
jgi:hypothetical protein